MGLFSFFAARTAQQKAVTATPAFLEAVGRASPYPALGGTNLRADRVSSAYVKVQNSSYSWIYLYSPAVRRVVDYIARNISQLGLKCYERISDDEREHRGDHQGAKALRNPNPQTPGNYFIQEFVKAHLVFGNAYALKFRSPVNGALTLVVLNPGMVGVVGRSYFSAEAYRIYRTDGTFRDVRPEDVLRWPATTGDDPRHGESYLETLREALAADTAAQKSVTELHRSGLTLPAWIERGVDAPEWSKEEAARFAEGFANQAKDSQRHVPIIEDGMQLKHGGVTPEDAQFIESRKHTLEYIASLYGMKNIPPETEDERRQFYADVLPPFCEGLTAFLDLHVLSQEYNADDHYFEFNLDEKLIGDDRLKALTSAAGVPPLTRNEARARLNLPAKDGGDELITPMNVIVGDNPKPSPQVMPIQNPLGPEQDGSHRDDEKSMNGNGRKSLIPRRAAQIRRRNRYAGEFEELLKRFFARQESARGKTVKAINWDRADSQLSDDLRKHLLRVVDVEGAHAAARLAMDDFDLTRTEAYLEIRAAETARAINAATKAQLQDGDPAEVFDQAKNFRAQEGALTLATFATGFAHTEAAKQTPDASNRTKSWIWSGSPNSRHPEMAGEVVGLFEDFSNGLQFPGEPNCACSVEIS